MALPRIIRRICRFMLGLFTVLAVIYGVLLVFELKCDTPTEEAHRVLVKVVEITEKQELRKTGRLGDIDSELRSGPKPHIIGLDYYRVIVQKTSSGYDVVIKPTGWCFCRATFILHDGGDRMEVVYPWLFHP